MKVFRCGSAADIQELCLSVELHRNAVRRHENTVALEKVQHAVLPEKHAAAFHAEKRMEAVLTGPEIRVLAVLGVQKKTLYLRLFMILNSVAWIVYELTLPTKNWAMAITFSIQLVATVIGLIRFDIKKKKEDTD